ncbi:MAG TPA: hypothetical protein VFY12_03775 [Arenimonas sp.]|nr:hypothetical protein [Arenimonas sp.]
MNIVGSQLSLVSSREFVLRESSRERLEIRQGSAPSGDSGRALGLANGPAAPAWERANERALAVARAFQPPPASTPPPVADDGSGTAEAIEAAQDEASNDPMLRMLIDLVERMTGRKVRLFDASELKAQDGGEALPDPNAAATPPARGGGSGFSLDYERHEIREEYEATQFRAEGVVRTADGQEIRFELALDMQRYYREESSVRIQIGEPPRKDPLVLNFAGTAAQLLDQRFSFDLDADGQADSLALLAGGSGFLAFDRDGNGSITDGRELFGALSGDGFADLRALDGDGNGWIDSGDSDFSQLRIWTPSADGAGSLHTLAEYGVAAISVNSVGTQFGLRGEGNSDLGQIRSTGVYLTAAGSVGTAQQIDLTV